MKLTVTGINPGNGSFRAECRDDKGVVTATFEGAALRHFPPTFAVGWVGELALEAPPVEEVVEEAALVAKEESSLEAAAELADWPTAELVPEVPAGEDAPAAQP